MRRTKLETDVAVNHGIISGWGADTGPISTIALDHGRPDA